MSDSKVGKVISGNSETAYERWQAPNVQSVQQQKQEQAGLLTASQLEELQKQAYDEGFQLGKEEGFQAAFPKGIEEGRQQGMLKGQEEVAQIIKRFEQIIQFLAEPLNQVNQEVEEELISLSLATAKQIIRREINIDPGQIVAVIKEALAALPSNSKHIKVFLHPADAQIARENLKLFTGTQTENSRIDNDDAREEFWSVIDEPTIARGGCKIKSEFSQIDASIEARIAEISARILGSERTSSDRGDPKVDTANRSQPDIGNTADEMQHELSSRSDSPEQVNSPEPVNSPEAENSLEPEKNPLADNSEQQENSHEQL